MPYVVGGAVRDMLLGLEVASKDLDFEVYHLSLEALIAALSEFGTVDAVGRSFGVIKLWMKGAVEVDFSLPRRESKSGVGHRGFLIEPDPKMTPMDACARRDFTLNAILMDPFDGSLMDFFGGRNDLRDKVLRHTSDHFSEDPLRPLRAVQLASRFGFSLHPDTASLCRAMTREAASLPKERIFGEWEKWAQKSTVPSLGLKVLFESGWHEVFFGSGSMLSDETRRNRLFSHVDRTLMKADESKMEPRDKGILLFSALTRDMEKDERERFLLTVGMSQRLAAQVSTLVQEARAFEESGFLRDEDILRSAVRLGADSISGLAPLLAAVSDEPSAVENFVSRAETLGVLSGPPKPLLFGRDLAALGISPGPAMGRLLKDAFEAQLTRLFTTKEEATKWAQSRLATPPPWTE